MLDYVWWVIGAGVVVVIGWQFGIKAGLAAILAVFGIKFVKQTYDRGRADEKAQQANNLEEVRQRHDEIAGKDHSPSDAYKHLRGLSRDRDD